MMTQQLTHSNSNKPNQAVRNFNRGRRAAMALATLATGVSYAALMSNRSAHATPLNCPVPDGTVIGGNDSIDLSFGGCSLGNTTILPDGQLDLNLSFTSAATLSRDSTLRNAGTLNNNTRTGSQFGVLGTLNNAATGVVNNLGDGSANDLYSSGGTINNAGVFNNRAVLFLRPNSGRDANFANLNSGTLVNGPDGTINNASRIDNAGLLTNAGRLETGFTGVLGSSGYGGDSILRNQGTLINTGTLISSRGSLGNLGVLNNSGQLDLNGGTYNAPSSTIYNSGLVNNFDRVDNQGRFYNRSGGVVNNANQFDIGFSDTAGVFNNEAGATLISSANLRILSSGILNNAGTLESDGLTGSSFTIDGAFVNRSGGVVNGSFNIISLYGGSIVNQVGALLEVTNNTENTFLISQAGSTIANEGEFRVGSRASVIGLQDVASNGADFTQTAGSTVVDGRLALNTVDIQGGTLSGSGTVSAASGPVTVSGGSVNPGNSPGTLTINGDGFDCFSCNIDIEVAGLGAGQFDLLDIEGEARFLPVLGAPNPSIEISFIDGFVPQAGDMFDFLTAGGGITGFDLVDFSIAGLPDGLEFDIGLTPNRTAINFFAFQTIGSGDGDSNPQPPTASVPEPATGGLLAFGLVAMGYLRRRFRPRPLATAA